MITSRLLKLSYIAPDSLFCSEWGKGPIAALIFIQQCPLSNTHTHTPAPTHAHTYTHRHTRTQVLYSCILQQQ